jgi:hypothetical protein
MTEDAPEIFFISTDPHRLFCIWLDRCRPLQAVQQQGKLRRGQAHRAVLDKSHQLQELLPWNWKAARTSEPLKEAA